MLVMKEVDFHGLRDNIVMLYDNCQYTETEIRDYLMTYEWDMPWLNKEKENTIIINKRTYEILSKLLHDNFELLVKGIKDDKTEDSVNRKDVMDGFCSFCGDWRCNGTRKEQIKCPKTEWIKELSSTSTDK